MISLCATIFHRLGGDGARTSDPRPIRYFTLPPVRLSCRIVKLRPAILFFAAIYFAAVPSFAQGEVWTGAAISFTNAPGSDPSQPANQDQLTGQVWLTRAGSKGLYNAAFEGGYTKFASPAGTEWALGALTDHAALTYTNWAWCYGGPGALLGNIVGADTVLHLVNEDIYLAITFTSFSAGGGFTYTRSTPLATPEPPANLILLGGTLFSLAAKKFRRR